MDSKQIYHIYKACRLCGAGGGYKMPIYQNFVDLNDMDLDIGQKIRDCVQIEVYDGDKMPPLICEICVDKVNEYYHFKQLCKETNVNTRKKLGLPVNTGSWGNSNSADDTVGKQIYFIKKEPDDYQSLINNINPKKEISIREKEIQLKNKEKELKTKEVNLKKKDLTLKSLNLELKTRQQELETLQQQLNAKELEIKQKETEKVKNNSLKNKELSDIKKEMYNLKKKQIYWKNKHQQTQMQFNMKVERLKLQISDLKAGSKTVKRKNETEPEEVDRSSRSSSVSKSAKRSKKSATPTKQDDAPVNIETSKVTPSNKYLKRSKTSQIPNKQEDVEANLEASKKYKVPSPKSTKLASNLTEVDKISCIVCGSSFKNKQALSKHIKCHSVTFTSPRLACDACKVWFHTNDEINSHHKTHRTNNIPYKCDSCCMEYSSDKDYQEHFSKQDCRRFYIVPDVQCLDCWNFFATETLKCQHKCLGEDGRPGGKCAKCNQNIDVWRELIIHEATCKGPEKAPSSGNLGNVKADPGILERLLSMQVRLIRCDTLINCNEYGFCNVETVKYDFGLDKQSVYPYLLPFRIKQEPMIPIDHMVSINPDFEEEFYSNYVHWDSDDVDSEVDQPNTIDSLTSLCLKVIFSKQMLGKVPKRRKRIKTEKSLSAISDSDAENNIDNIIDSLDADIEKNEAVTDDIIDTKANLNNKDENIKLLNINNECNSDDASQNKDLVLNYCERVASETNESQFKTETAYIEHFTQVDSFKLNDNVIDDDVTNFRTVKNITIDNNTKEVEQNQKALNGICKVLKSINNDTSVTEVNSYNNTESNESDTKDEKQININFNDTESNASSINANNKKQANLDDVEIKSTDNSEVGLDRCEEEQEEVHNVVDCTKIDENKTKIDEENVQNVKNHEEMNEKKQKEDYNAIHHEEILKNDTEVNENKTEKYINDQIQNSRTEMETLMKDLSDLSKTDETQENLTNTTNKNIEKTDSDSENDKFMKELDKQIGESNEEAENSKENKDENGLKMNNYDDLNIINKELEKRMENDLNNGSDEEFDFNA